MSRQVPRCRSHHCKPNPEGTGYMGVSSRESKRRACEESNPDRRASKARVLSITPHAQRCPWTESNRHPPVYDTGAPTLEPLRHGSGRTCTCIVPFCGRAHCSSATDPNAPAAIRTRTAAVTGRHPDRVGPRGHALARRLRSSPPFRAYVVPEFVPRGSTEVGRARLARASAVLETARLLVTDTAPWDRERESNARLEGHNLASWPLDDRGHWVAARGVAPRSPAHEAGMFRLHHAAMEGLEKRGVRRPLGRVELPKARLLDACQTHSGVSGRLPQRRNVHRENPRRAPAAYIPLGHHARWCRSRRAVVGSVRLTGPSPEPRFSSMLRRHFSRRGRRRAELHRDLRFE